MQFEQKEWHVGFAFQTFEDCRSTVCLLSPLAANFNGREIPEPQFLSTGYPVKKTYLFESREAFDGFLAEAIKIADSCESNCDSYFLYTWSERGEEGRVRLFARPSTKGA